MQSRFSKVVDGIEDSIKSTDLESARKVIVYRNDIRPIFQKYYFKFKGKI